MNFKALFPGGPVLIEPRLFHDERGYFFESYNADVFARAGIDFTFKQDNESHSSKGVLRGLHFQNPPYEQGKLIRVVKGAVLDVVVDIRKSSGSYGRHDVVEINAESKLMLWIPPGFAHGFVSLEDDTVFLYKCTNVYNKDSESGIRWDDPLLGINWGIDSPKISEKDLLLGNFADFINLF